MAEGKNKIIVYADWLSTFDELTDEELGKLMRHFFEYVNEMNPVLEDRLLKLAWKPIETTLKRDLKKWEEKSLQNKANALKRWNENANASSRIKTNAKTADRDRDRDRDKDKDKDKVIDSLKKRKTEFKNSLSQFLGKYNKDLINEFYSYWTERSEKGRLMRFEMAKNQPFSISRRIATFQKNEKQWNNRKDTRLFPKNVKVDNRGLE